MDRAIMVTHPSPKGKIAGSSPVRDEEGLWCNWLAQWALNPLIRVQVPAGPEQNKRQTALVAQLAKNGSHPKVVFVLHLSSSDLVAQLAERASAPSLACRRVYFPRYGTTMNIVRASL